MNKQVIFVHGFGGDRREYQKIISYLRGKGINDFYEFSYEKNLGQIPINEISFSLDEFVKQNVDYNNSTILVGLSQGGIIGSYYLEYLDGKKVINDCITVCTPYYGSYFSYLWSSPGVRDLRPNGDLLESLRDRIEKSKVNYYGVWNPFDLFVFPGKNADAPFLKKSLKVTSLLHPKTFWKPKTKEFIYKIITQS